MAQTIYSDGSIYNDGSLYGRIDAALLAAAETKHRETALRITLLDEQLNKWEHVTGTHSQSPNTIGERYAAVNNGVRDYQKAFYSYRGGIGMCTLGNGSILRTRVGDPNDVNDRQIWYQIITDGGVAAQWGSWSVLYSGTHYSATVVSDGTPGGFIVYHGKSDGVYRNNIRVAQDNIDYNGEAVGFAPIQGAIDAGWIVVFWNRDLPGDRKRVIDLYYTSDITDPGNFFYDSANYQWYRRTYAGLLLGDGRVARLLGAPLHHDPRQGATGMELWVQFQEDLSDETRVSAPHSILGVGGGGSGMNMIHYGVGGLQKFSDGYYYLHGMENHTSTMRVDGVATAVDLTSMGFGMPVWMRSKDLIHWSAPVVGPPSSDNWGIYGVVEQNGYLYWADFEVVYRRPIGSVSYDVSNYVPSVSFELPRDNQPGSGQLTVANPNGINNAIKKLSDREIKIEPGLRGTDGQFHYAQFDRFFVKQVNREVKGKANRLTVQFGNLWDRLDNPLRDIRNFIGKLDWNDFGEGLRNQPFNYFFATDTAPTVTASKQLKTKGIVLLTAWKGHFPDITVKFSSVSGDPMVIFRYTDKDNYSFVQIIGGTIMRIGERSKGVDYNHGDSNIPSFMQSSNPKIRVRIRFSLIEIWINDEQFYNWMNDSWKNVKQGYIGFSANSYQISNLHVSDWEAPLTTEDLVRTALALSDFHDVIVGAATSRVYALIWGPQTDIPTPADGLRMALETDKLQMIWRNGSVEVGKFNDPAIIKTIRDEVVEADEIDEAKRRINIASTDGNEHSWIEVDTKDATDRGRMVVGYFDLPELLDLDAVVERSREEIKRSTQGASPGGTTPLFFDLWRMDHVLWVDNEGNEAAVRIEGFSVDISQGKEPHQRQTFDTSLISEGSTGRLMVTQFATLVDPDE